MSAVNFGVVLRVIYIPWSEDQPHFARSEEVELLILYRLSWPQYEVLGVVLCLSYHVLEVLQQHAHGPAEELLPRE